MDKPLVTVVIPTYNYAPVVARAIESVMAQTVKDIECFIVDDGSTDNTREVVEKAIANDARFHYIHQENKGVAHARNKGVFSGTSKYVCALDADDKIDPRFLEVCVDALEKDRMLGIAYTGLWYIKPDGSEGLSTWPGVFDYDAALKGQNQIPTCNVSRRVIWERLGGQRQRYAPDSAGEEDAEMWLRAGAYGWKAQKVTDAGLFIYSWMSGRVSGNRDHVMTDYASWHPWVKDGQHPFGSQAKPKNFSHPVRQYDEPVVSVIIPVGPGHEKEVINALDSLDAQTYRKWEVIVVWDNPEDTKYLENAFPHIRWVKPLFSQRGYGAGYSRNRGAEIARAPLLLFLDADDWLYPSALTDMIDAWEKEQTIVYTDYVGKAQMSLEDAGKYQDRMRYYDKRTGTAVIGYRSADYDCDYAVNQPMIGSNGYLYVWCLMTALVPRDYHHQIGGFDEKMASWEDWDYWIRMAKAGRCFYHLKKELVVYRFNTGKRREEGLQGHEKLLQYLQDKYKDGTTMPCGCQKNAQQAAMPQMANQILNQGNTMVNNQGDDNFVMVSYDHPNRGGHKVVGPMTKTNYGYRQGGDRFLVHILDVQSMPNIFHRIVDQVNIDREEKPVPPPVSIAKAEPAPVVEEDEPVKAPFKEFDLQAIPGITPISAQILNGMGVHSYQDIADLGEAGLLEIKGIAAARAKIIIKFVNEKLHDEQPV